MIDAVSSGKIMIVDDDPFSLKLLMSYLNQAGYQVFSFQSALEAVDKVLRVQPEMILLDVHMEEMDGFETCSRIKARLQTAEAPVQDIPVIFVTGENETASILKGFELGAVDYIAKPIRRQELLARLRTHLSLSRLQIQLQEQNLRLEDEIRQRQVAEVSLIESEEKFRSIAASAHDAIILLDQQTRIIFWNQAAERMFGYSVAEITGKPVRILIGPDYTSYLADTSLGVLVGLEGQGAIDELLAVRKDGRAFSIELSISTTHLRGSIVLVGIVRDITERKQMMAAIEQAKREWQAAFDSMTDMIFLTDPGGSILRCNRASVERMMAHTDQGLNWSALLDSQIDHLFFGERSTQKLDYVKEVQFPTLEGWYDVNVYPVQGEQGLQMKVYLVKDITTRKKMEAALISSQKMASLGTLVAGIAHEINSPLQVLTGVADGLLTDTVKGMISPERLKMRLEMLRRNSWRVAEIVRALRTYAHGSDDYQVFQPIELDSLINDVLLLIKHQLQTWDNIQIHIDLAPNLPPLPCDREKISQVLINLFNNARDAMANGGEITLRAFFDESTEQIIMEVQDTGSGIPESVRAKIFDPFFTTKPLGEGTGLGLSIVMGIVRLHGGEIRVDSEPGRGSTFRIALPLNPPATASSTERGTPGSLVGRQGRFDDTVLHS